MATSNNTILYQARLSFIIFFWPIVFLGAAFYLFFNFPMLYTFSLIVGGFSIVWFFMMWVAYQFSSLTIKKKQLILRTGVIVRKTIDIPMDKIESIDITQSIIGSLLHYGTLVITGTGGTKQFMNNINRPLTCRRYIEQWTQ